MDAKAPIPSIYKMKNNNDFRAQWGSKMYICHINTPKKKHNKKRPEMLLATKNLGMPLLRPKTWIQESTNHTEAHFVAGFFHGFDLSFQSFLYKVSRKIRDKSQLIGQPSKNHTSVYLSGCFTGFSKNGNICLLILTLTQLSRNSLGHEDGF